MLTRITHTVTYESAIERFRYEVTTTRLFGIVPIYTKKQEIWRKPGLVDDDTRAVVFALDDWQCVYCGASNETALSIDHRIPQSQGGTSHITNLLTACRSCNSAKHDKTPEEARLSMTYGRFLEPSPAIEYLITTLIGRKWIWQYRIAELPHYAFYCLYKPHLDYDKNSARRQGQIRRIYLHDHPHLVIRRSAWSAFEALLGEVLQNEYERHRRMRLEYVAWSLKLAKDEGDTDTVEMFSRDLERDGIEPDKIFEALGIRTDFPPRGYIAYENMRNVDEGD